MAGLKTFAGNKIKNIFKLYKFYKQRVMFLRHAFLLCVCIGTLTAKAQNSATTSMLPDVSAPNLEKLIELAKQNYPRVKAFDHRVTSAEMNVKKAKLGWYDIFTFTFLYSPNNSTTLVNPSILNGYQIGVFFNVGTLIRNPVLIKQAKEEQMVSEAERDEYYLNLATMVKERYYIYIQQLTILKVRTASLFDAESNMELVKHKYEKGEATLDDYNKSLVNLSDRTQSKIESEGALLIAKSSLEELIGKKLEDVN